MPLPALPVLAADGPLLDWLSDRILTWPWAVPAGSLGPGVPSRDTPLRVLERHLLEEASYPERDRIWAGIVTLARTPDTAADYRTVALTLAAKGLRGFRNRLPARNRDEVCDIDADLAYGLLRRVTTIDLAAPRVGGRLIDSAIGHAKGRWRLHLNRPTPSLVDPDTRAQPTTGSLQASFDALLAAAARAGEPLDPRTIDLIVRTRLDRQSLEQAAAELGLPLPGAYKRRKRAEARLRRFLPTRPTANVRSEGVMDSDAIDAGHARADEASAEAPTRRTPAAPDPR
ncbi:MAG: sigma-70 family RNA polymerase sigma factor [Dactylosporangium sp.]|nr:hypothetical protein [Dactylosporangium sp.]NNJ63905.1 sigma-70 family RNA polymerase sigma factor [Dactylosporangium sp.]